MAAGGFRGARAGLGGGGAADGLEALGLRVPPTPQDSSSRYPSHLAPSRRKSNHEEETARQPAHPASNDSSLALILRPRRLLSLSWQTSRWVSRATCWRHVRENSHGRRCPSAIRTPDCRVRRDVCVVNSKCCPDSACFVSWVELVGTFRHFLSHDSQVTH